MIAALSGVVSRIRTVLAVRLLLAAFLVATFSDACRAWEPWRFIATCDSRGQDNGIEKTILGEFVAEIVGSEVDFVLFPGDLVTGYLAAGPGAFEAQLRAWVETMKPVYDGGIGVYVCRGNHEIADAWGNAAFNLDPDDVEALDTCRRELGLKNRSDTVRALIRYFSGSPRLREIELGKPLPGGEP